MRICTLQKGEVTTRNKEISVLKQHIWVCGFLYKHTTSDVEFQFVPCSGKKNERPDKMKKMYYHHIIFYHFHYGNVKKKQLFNG